MTRIIRKNLKNFVAIVALASVSLGVAYYILQNQRLRIPLLEDKPMEFKAEFTTAQAVTPGQGQTVRIAGVRIGDITKAELVEGRAVVTFTVEKDFEDIIRTDAQALLRPKTGLKDMFIELDPGTKQAPLAKEGWTVPLSNTLPDVNPDEFLAGLDADTRDYLALLLHGAGQGLKGRRDDLRDVLRRFEPTHRDLAAVTGEVRKRRVELRRLVNSLNRLNAEVADKDDDLAELIGASSRVFRAFASERRNVTATVHELPSTLKAATNALGKVERMAAVLGPAAEALRPVGRALEKTNAQTQPFNREAAPLLRDDIRPFVREARPVVRDLQPAVKDLVAGEPGLKRSFTALNQFFNLLGYNAGGRQGANVPNRDEGYLFYLAWLGHQTNNLFQNADAHGAGRPITTGGTCATLRQGVELNPQLEAVLGLSGALTDRAVCGGG